MMSENRTLLFSVALPLCLALGAVASPRGSGASSVSTAPSPSVTGPSLTLEQCLELALAHHPSLTSSRGSWKVARARQRGARAGWLPQLTLSASRAQTELTRQSSTSSAVTQAGVVLGGSGSRQQESDTKRASLSLRQMVTDFGKTSHRMEATRHNTRAAGLDLDNAVQEVVLGVEEAYFNLLAARDLLVVNRQTVERARAHVNLAKGFVEVGRRPRFDLTKAQVDLSNAEVSLIQARNAVEVARVALANALGLEGELPGEPSERPVSTPPELTREQAIQLGLTSRRDLASTAEKLTASRASLGSARAGYRPVLSVAAGRTLRGETYPLDRQADLSFSLDWNLFDGHLTKAAVAEARAQTEILQGQLDTLRQKVVADIQKNYLDMGEALARVRATGVSLTQARENLELARGRYAEGVGSPIEVTDAELSLASAESARVRAQYDFEIAVARLQRSTGQIRTEVQR